MAKRTAERLLGAAGIFAGVCLIAAGIGLILRSDYTTSGGWAVIALAPAAIIVGTVLVFIPVFRWFLMESRANATKRD